MNIRYTIKQAVLQIIRNKAMSFASVFSIMAMLIILGMTFIVVVNLNTAMDRVRDSYDTIIIHLQDEIPQWQVENIMSTLDGMDEVDGVTFLHRDEALRQWREEWGDNAHLLDTLQENPLPDGVIVQLASLEGAYAVATRANNFDYILEVRYYGDVVETLMRVTNFIQMAAFAIMIVLIVISVVVVSNTIKLTVFARVEEINIMKYIGATNWFIRGPFLLEGMLIGIISAAASVGIISFVYDRITELIQGDIMGMFSIRLVSVSFMTYNLFWIFLALGIGIGACGSIISMRRFLDT